MKPKITTTIKTATTYELRVSREQLVDMLRANGFAVSEDAEVTVRVPGGGDYSNTNLDIDRDADIKITWKEAVTEVVK